MNTLIVLSALFVVTSASHLGIGSGASGPVVRVPVYVGTVTTGLSTQFRSEDNHGNYNFGYDESHATGGSSRREEESNGVRRGSYSLHDADGRRRVVNYIADDTGFHATIETNEPGVEPKDPANVSINKAAHAVPISVPLPAPIASPAYGAAPIAAPLPAPIAARIFGAGVKGGYARQRVLPAPGSVYSDGPIDTDPVYDHAPRSFSYSFGANHGPQIAAPAYAAPIPIAHGPAPVAAPVYQQRQEY